MRAWLWRALGAFIPLQTSLILGGVVINGGLSEFARVQIPVAMVLVVATWIMVRGRDVVRTGLTRDESLLVAAFVGLFTLSLWRAPLPIAVTLAVWFQIVSVICLVDLMRSSSDRGRWLIEGFLTSMIASVFLGAWQVVTGSSPASTLLGLSARDAERLGESVVMIGDHRVLRAYGLFPHPNVFAGYLVVALAFVVTRRDDGRWERYATRFPVALFVLGLLLTASRAGVLAAAVMTALLLARRHRPAYEHHVFMAVILLVFTLWIAALLLPDAVAMLRGGGVLEIRSIAERRDQIIEWWRIWAQNVTTMFFGVGFRDYTIALHDLMPGSPVWHYQPVHNTLLLSVAEFGLAGCALLVYMLKNLTRRIPRSVLAAIVTLALFDHYFLTLPAGLFLLALATDWQS